MIHFRSNSLDTPLFALRWDGLRNDLGAVFRATSRLYFDEELRSFGRDDEGADMFAAAGVDPALLQHYDVFTFPVMPDDGDYDRIDHLRKTFSPAVVEALKTLPGFSVEGMGSELILYPGSIMDARLLTPEEIPSLLKRATPIIKAFLESWPAESKR